MEPKKRNKERRGGRKKERSSKIIKQGYKEGEKWRRKIISSKQDKN
jgi:hypothetical protein